MYAESEGTVQATEPTINTSQGEQNHESALLSSFLRSAREETNFTIEQAAADAHIESERLARIEIGAASPTSEELDALCEAYGCDIDSTPASATFLPQLPSRAHRNGEWFMIGPVIVSLEDATTNGEILDAVGRAIRRLRSLGDDAAVHPRASELPLIASVLDLECEGLPIAITQSLRLSVVKSYELVDAMRGSLDPESQVPPR